MERTLEHFDRGQGRPSEHSPSIIKQLSFEGTEGGEGRFPFGDNPGRRYEQEDEEEGDPVRFWGRGSEGATRDGPGQWPPEAIQVRGVVYSMVPVS
jgi:diadenosine tetraphosphatase ApaH/serine/threonine PP2A family protein phosphatase